MSVGPAVQIGLLARPGAPLGRPAGGTGAHREKGPLAPAESEVWERLVGPTVTHGRWFLIHSDALRGLARPSGSESEPTKPGVLSGAALTWCPPGACVPGSPRFANLRVRVCCFLRDHNTVL